jgi:hypothetical protein
MGTADKNFTSPASFMPIQSLGGSAAADDNEGGVFSVFNIYVQLS